MSNKDDSVYLKHILDAIGKIEQYTKDIEKNTFVDNSLI